MAKVNVPEQKIPAVFFELSNSSNKEVSSIAKALVEYLEKDSFFQFQMWKRSGGSGDLVNDIVSSDTFESSLSSVEALDRLDNLEGLEEINQEVINDYSDVKDGAYTAINGDWIESRGATITLDPKGDPRDEITVSIGSNKTTKIVADKIKWKDKIVSCVESSRAGNSYTFRRFSYKDDNYWRVI